VTLPNTRTFQAFAKSLHLAFLKSEAESRMCRGWERKYRRPSLKIILARLSESDVKRAKDGPNVANEKEVPSSVFGIHECEITSDSTEGSIPSK
jgi:hypothetical protein